MRMEGRVYSPYIELNAVFNVGAMLEVIPMHASWSQLNEWVNLATKSAGSEFSMLSTGVRQKKQ